MTIFPLAVGPYTNTGGEGTNNGFSIEVMAEISAALSGKDDETLAATRLNDSGAIFTRTERAIKFKGDGV
jgi:hypothetical protein